MHQRPRTISATRRVVSWLLIVSVVVAVPLTVIWLLQRRLMYFPIREVPPPETLGLVGVETVEFETSDGLRLHAWFLPTSGGRSPQPSVLVFNGNGGNRSHRAPLAAALRRRGLHVLLVDYRGYGGNPGRPTELGLAADARAAHQYLTTRAEVDPSRLVYFGESLGTAVAIGLATRHPPAALVLRSPFTSAADLGQHHYPWLPVAWLLRDRFPAADAIRRVQSPLLVVAGSRDRIVPIEFSRRLFEAAAEPKRFVSLSGAAHNDYAMLAGDELLDAIMRFLDELAGMRPEV